MMFLLFVMATTPPMTLLLLHLLATLVLILFVLPSSIP